jgi:hypothetical protein
MRLRPVLYLALALTARTLDAQGSAADGSLLGARHLGPTAQIKLFNAAGSVRLVGWDRDSIVVRGRVARGERFYMAGGGDAIKLGIDEQAGARESRRCDLVIWMPKHSRVNVKTVSADVAGRDVSGWFYSVSGAVRLGGTASSLDVLSMSGDVDLDVATPWVRARTGDGHLTLRGAPEDADVSTIGGRLDVTTSTVMRGQFATVSGGIRFVGSPAPNAIFDFSSHGGDIELAMPPSASGRFTLSSVVGRIENAFVQARPASAPEGAPPHALTMSLGRGDARVTVRTYRGAIRLRVQ